MYENSFRLETSPPVIRLGDPPPALQLDGEHRSGRRGGCDGGKPAEFTTSAAGLSSAPRAGLRWIGMRLDRPRSTKPSAGSTRWRGRRGS